MSEINYVFLHFHKFFESYFQKSKNNPVEILTGRCPLLKSIITFERDQSIMLMTAKQFTMNNHKF